MKKYILLLAIHITSCAPQGDPTPVSKVEVRFAADVEGRTIHLFVREDTAHGGTPVRYLKLDDPQEKDILHGYEQVSDPDSMVAVFQSGTPDEARIKIAGIRGDAGTWRLDYTRGDSGVPLILTLKEDPTALVFEQQEYRGSTDIRTYRITDRATGRPHPLDSVLQDMICHGKTYAERAGTAQDDATGSENYGVSIEYQADDRIVLEVHFSYYEEGMAHPQGGSRFMNYDLVDNRELKLADVISARNQAKLKALAKKLFYATYTDRSMRSSNFKLTDNVAFRRSGIEFKYRAYEMGPYVMGEMGMTIPYTEIMDLMDTSSNLYKALTSAK